MMTKETREELYDIRSRLRELERKWRVLVPRAHYDQMWQSSHVNVEVNASMILDHLGVEPKDMPTPILVKKSK